MYKKKKKTLKSVCAMQTEYDNLAALFISSQPSFV